MKIVNVTAATPIGGCKLRLSFDDGKAQEVDFKPFLQQSLHPDIRAFLDPSLFATYRVEHGELVWGDFDLCFPIMDLYTNQIDKHHTLKAVT